MVLSKERKTRPLLLRRRWLLPIFILRILPEAVLLNLLAVVLWVFILGILPSQVKPVTTLLSVQTGASSARLKFHHLPSAARLALFLLSGRSQDHEHAPALHTGMVFHDAYVTQNSCDVT